MHTIYVFCNGKDCDGRGNWHVGCAVAEDGTPLASHVSSNHAFIKCDLGNNRLGYRGFNRDKEYNAKYPDGYEVVWVEGAELDALVAGWNAKEKVAARGADVTQAKEPPMSAPRGAQE